jgi:hypothetical protein
MTGAIVMMFRRSCGGEISLSSIRDVTSKGITAVISITPSDDMLVVAPQASVARTSFDLPKGISPTPASNGYFLENLRWI